MIYQSRLFRYVVLTIAAIMIFPIVYGGKMAWDKQTNRVEDWLPETFEETRQLMWFLERFGSDELLMISWDGCSLEDERLVRYAEELQKPVTIDGVKHQWFRLVWTGEDIQKILMDKPISLTHEEAVERMQGWLVGPDGHTTCAIALVSPEGVADRAAAVDHAFKVAHDVTDLPRESIYIAGPTYDGVAINRASKESLLQFNLWSFLVCFTILYLSLKSWRLAMIVFVCALFAQQCSMASMYYTGVPMDSILLLVANLAFVLTVACGIHLVNYYIDARKINHEDPVAFQSRLRSGRH